MPTNHDCISYVPCFLASIPGLSSLFLFRIHTQILSSHLTHGFGWPRSLVPSSRSSRSSSSSRSWHWHFLTPSLLLTTTLLNLSLFFLFAFFLSLSASPLSTGSLPHTFSFYSLSRCIRSSLSAYRLSVWSLFFLTSSFSFNHLPPSFRLRTRFSRLFYSVISPTKKGLSPRRNPYPSQAFS